jgi:hypothetical protein
VLKKEMRNEHFKIGNFENDYRPMSVSSFRDVKGKPARLDSKTANDLRAHHFGEKGINNWVTSYRDFYSNQSKDKEKKNKKKKLDLLIRPRFF